MHHRTMLALILLLLPVFLATHDHPAAHADLSSPPSDRRIYLPLITRPAMIDLVLNQVEITQSVQNGAGSVPFVANRPAVARVYVTVSGVTEASNVIVEASATRNGVPLPGSPRRSDPRTVTTSVSRGNYASSFNLALPAEWLSGSVRLSIVVDPDNRITEVNETNNGRTQTLEFLAVPRLDLTIVPVQYTHTPNGRTYPAPTRDTVSDWVMRAYPIPGINVRLRAPVAFTGDLRRGDEWERLLDLITDVKLSDGAPSSRVYYGLIPIASGSDRWFSSGIAGIGWVGLRASVGLDLTGSSDAAGRLAAHEIGHNLGRFHAPCGVSGDPRQPFPYPNASIGSDVYGLDISRARVWSPVAPDDTKDLMSYCQPQWVSDFTYQGLLNNQRTYGASVMQSGVGYLVRAALTDDGATLEPVYALNGVMPDAPRRGEYTVELLDAAGALLASHTVAAVEAEGPYHYGEETVEHDHDHRHIYRRITAVVPAPVGPVACFRLIRDGVVIAERANDAAPPAVAASATIARNDATWTLSWSNATVPALVRYTHDGKRWTSLGVDLVGGRLSLDPQTLPGDGHGRFEIVLADGGGIIIVDGTPAAADDAQPQAWIDGPATLPVGAPLLLYGRASDRDDGALDDPAWQVNGVSVGTGQTVFLDNLAPGEYHVRLTARDSAGNVGYADHLVRVEQR